MYNICFIHIFDIPLSFQDYEPSPISVDNDLINDIMLFRTYHSKNQDAVSPSMIADRAELLQIENEPEKEVSDSLRLLAVNNENGRSGVWSLTKRISPRLNSKVRSHSDLLKFIEDMKLDGFTRFPGFNKKGRDYLSGATDLTETKKRAFDSIAGASGFGGFKKRLVDLASEPNGFDEFNRREFGSISGFGENTGRTLDRELGTREYRGSRRRALDSISGPSEIGGFKKRAFDSISGASGFGGFKKRRINSTPRLNGFQHYKKRSFDSIAGASDFGGLGKRSFDSIEHRSFFGGFGKRSFDSIGHMSAFGSFPKRSHPKSAERPHRFNERHSY